MTPTQNMRERMLRVLIVEKKIKYVSLFLQEKRKKTEKSKHWNLFKIRVISTTKKINEMGLIPEKMNESKGHKNPFFFLIMQKIRYFLSSFLRKGTTNRKPSFHSE
jgi:hypothetical protein